MGIFSDLLDATKKRLNDPPSYKSEEYTCDNCHGSCKCSSCNGSGKCKVCNGSTTGFSAFLCIMSIGATITLPIILGMIMHSFLLFFILIIVLGIISLKIYNNYYCYGCQYNALDTDYAGKCRYCSGSTVCYSCKGTGKLTRQVQVGGVTFSQSYSKTREATHITNEVIADFKNINSNSIHSLSTKITKALNLNPNNFAANAIKGILLYQEGKMKDALIFLHNAEGIKNKNIEVLSMLCCIYEEIGDYRKSEIYYNKIVEIKQVKQNRIIFAKNVAAGFVGGISAGLISYFINDLDA